MILLKGDLLPKKNSNWVENTTYLLKCDSLSHFSFLLFQLIWIPLSFKWLRLRSLTKRPINIAKNQVLYGKKLANCKISKLFCCHFKPCLFRVRTKPFIFHSCNVCTADASWVNFICCLLAVYFDYWLILIISNIQLASRRQEGSDNGFSEGQQSSRILLLPHKTVSHQLILHGLNHLLKGPSLTLK